MPRCLRHAALFIEGAEPSYWRLLIRLNEAVGLRPGLTSPVA